MLFQSNLRKQIRKLPKILKFVRIIHYYSKLFTGVLSAALLRFGHAGDGRAGPRDDVPALHVDTQGFGEERHLGCKKGFELNLNFKLF